MASTLIDRAGVARMLGITVEVFYRRYRDLLAVSANPFPGPVMGRMSGSRWDPAAIAKWIAAGGEFADAAAPAAMPAPPAFADNDAYADLLDRRAARLGGRS